MAFSNNVLYMHLLKPFSDINVAAIVVGVIEGAIILVLIFVIVVQVGTCVLRYCILL